jgi:hypothetical protein
MIMLSQAEHARSQQVGGVRRFLEPRKPDAKPAAQGCGHQGSDMKHQRMLSVLESTADENL